GLVCLAGPFIIQLAQGHVPAVADRPLVILREGGQRLPLRSVVAYRIEQLLALRRPSDRDPSPPRPPAVAGQPVNRSVAVWEPQGSPPPTASFETSQLCPGFAPA